MEQAQEPPWFAKRYAGVASEHAIESLTPSGIDGGPDELLIDCTCGESFTIPVGGYEGDRADTAMAVHAGVQP
jgi:hypothetical protein